MNRPRALLLDLDGTIADTLPHIFNAFRHAVAPWVDRPPTDAQIEATFGPPERDCLAQMVPPDALGEADSRFHAYYEEHHATGIALVEGIAEAVDHARGLGWRVGIFTNKGRRAAAFSVEALGLAEQVEFLVTGDDLERPKPHPDGLFRAAEALGVEPSRVLLAGDSPVDVQAGKAAGARTAAVLWAAFRPERLRNSGADFTCTKVDELVAAIDALHAER